MEKFIKKYRPIGFGEGDREALEEWENSKKKISEDNPDSLIMDGYDDCIAGMVEIYGKDPIVCYDKSKVIKKLVNDGMDSVEALEYFEFNQLGAYVGKKTPCFIDTEYEI